MKHTYKCDRCEKEITCKRFGCNGIKCIGTCKQCREESKNDYSKWVDIILGKPK